MASSLAETTFSDQNALKFTYINIKFQQISGKKPGPQYQGSDPREMVAEVVERRDGEVAREGDGRRPISTGTHMNDVPFLLYHRSLLH